MDQSNKLSKKWYKDVKKSWQFFSVQESFFKSMNNHFICLLLKINITL